MTIPIFYHYSVSAVLSNGWIPVVSHPDDEWLRKGDYFSASMHIVNVVVDEDEFRTDITVVCYQCQEADHTEL